MTSGNELEALRARIETALYESMDRCARCKVCDTQINAVMDVIKEAAAINAQAATCPQCGTADWDFIGPGQAQCASRHQWQQAPDVPGTFVRPGYPGDMNDPERFPDDDEGR